MSASAAVVSGNLMLPRPGSAASTCMRPHPLVPSGRVVPASDVANVMDVPSVWGISPGRAPKPWRAETIPYGTRATATAP
jgi:hypothetical protein